MVGTPPDALASGVFAHPAHVRADRILWVAVDERDVALTHGAPLPTVIFQCGARQGASVS